jgi:hypothetical protein
VTTSLLELLIAAKIIENQQGLLYCTALSRIGPNTSKIEIYKIRLLYLKYMFNQDPEIMLFRFSQKHQARAIGFTCEMKI